MDLQQMIKHVMDGRWTKETSKTKFCHLFMTNLYQNVGKGKSEIYSHGVE